MAVNVRFIALFLSVATALATIANLVHFRIITPQQPTDLLSEAARGPTRHANTTRASAPADDQEEAAPQSPYAFVAFLADNWQHKAFDDDDDDAYFYATRVMGYQLMHNPATRTNTSIPFVVLTTTGVSERKRARLRSDGAVVVVVDDVPLPDWIEIANPKWRDVMTKLRVFQQTRYDKILLLDADVLPVRRLDGVFQDTAAEVVESLPDRRRAGDRIPLPQTYMFAGMTTGGGRDHDSETEETYYASMAQYGELDQVNAGFLLAAPSQGIYDYYSALLREPGRFDPGAPEQNMLIEAHRVDGPMPWRRLRYDWVINSPNFGDYEHGVHGVHEKLWKAEHRGEEHGLKDLAALWDRARGGMEGYYRALEDPSPTTRRVRAEGG